METLICEWCKNPFERKRYGRGPRYCCHACRQLAFTARRDDQRKRAIQVAMAAMNLALECPEGCDYCKSVMRTAVEELAELPEALP